jgi:hypothetical protein
LRITPRTSGINPEAPGLGELAVDEELLER